MSGIGGVIYLDGRPVEPAELDGLRQRLAWRGPDAAGIWHAGPAGLVHALFRTTPESLSEQQPLASEDGRLVITADARLDNRAELCAALGRRDEGQPDAALILAAYARWGEACAERLLGDFAFAIWEAAERRLFCARDALGVRPFFYHHGPGLFVFGSTLEAVARQPGVPRAVNEARAAIYLAGGRETTLTFYRDILRLPPAHTLRVTPTGQQLRQYWDLHAPRETRLPSDEAYAEAFRERLTDAVQARLRSAYPVAAMLSGGLDSTAVVCIARPWLRERGQPLHTISLLYDTVRTSDEREYMEAALEVNRERHHTALADPISAVTRVEELISVYGEPFFHMGLAIQALANDTARAAGARVLLDGSYGDAVVSHGNLRVAEWLRTGHWVTALREAAGLAEGLRPHWKYTLAYLWLVGVKPLIPSWARQTWRAGRVRFQPGRPYWAAGHIILPDFARRMRRDPAVRAWIDSLGHAATTTREDGQASASRIVEQTELYNQMGTYAGLEMRHPFADRRLVEFCLGLPSEQRLRDGWGRFIQRQALEGILPEAIRLRRTKATPARSVGRALLERDLEDLERLLQMAPRASQWINMAQVERDYARLRQHAAEQHYNFSAQWREVTRLTRALQLAVWLTQADLI
jgi:asparagine synthase (glutamine-hydrolysing)